MGNCSKARAVGKSLEALQLSPFGDLEAERSKDIERSGWRGWRAWVNLELSMWSFTHLSVHKSVRILPQFIIIQCLKFPWLDLGDWPFSHIFQYVMALWPFHPTTRPPANKAIQSHLPAETPNFLSFQASERRRRELPPGVRKWRDKTSLKT